jgi:hypothetical protein
VIVVLRRLLCEFYVCLAMLLCLFVCLFTQGGVALVLGTCSQYCCACMFKQDFVLVLRCLVQCGFVCVFIKQCAGSGVGLFSMLL